MKPSTIYSLSLSVLTFTLCGVLVHGGIYNEHVVELTPRTFDKLVIDSTETWLVKFYAPWCGHCQSSAPAFSKAAKRLRGVAKLGVVNCDEHKEIAHKYGIQGFPTIKIFKGEGYKQRKRPSDYNSERSSKAFIDHVKYVMPSYVARVKSTGIDAFFNDLPKLPHVLLFTEQSQTSPLYKGMSAKFKKSLAFGEIKKSDSSTNILSQFNVNKFPSLIAFPSGINHNSLNTEDDKSNIIYFKGNLDPESLDKFFNNLSTGKNITDDDFNLSEEASEEKKEKVFSQPKPYSGEINNIIGKRNYDDLCGSRKDGRMCVLSFLSGGLNDDMNEILKPIAKKYAYDNMAFATMNTDLDQVKLYASLFSLSDNKNGVIVIRSRKNKFTMMESDEINANNVAAFLDKIVGGDARWKKMSGDTPQWEVEEEEDGKEKDEHESENQENAGQCGKAPESDGGQGSCGSSAHEDL